MKTHTLRRAISIALFATAAGTTGLAVAQSSDGRETARISNEAQDAQHFDLAPGALEASLDAFGAQSGRHIAYPPELVANRQGRAVQGRMHWRDAVAMLLQGSGLDYREGEDGTVVIEPARADAQRRTATDLETITVTGTRIRGGTTPSPVITLGSERIREEGFADLGEVIRSVPQNFSGGQNPGVLSGNLAGAGNANQNVTGGSSLNLRGLGADATLTLLNGRRMAYGGITQAVDISAIPLEAVERIEIVADGASAIYGSDAVGGVGNVLLKRDFDGVSVGARYGASSQGGLTTREYTATAGATWSGGGLIATYKDASVDPIYSDRRAYTEQLVDPSTLYPGSDLRSALLSAHQAMGEVLEFRLDALRSERDQLHLYNFSGRHSRVTPDTTTTLVSPGVDLWLPNDWTLSLGGTSGSDRHNQYQQVSTIATGAPLATVYECLCNDSRAYEFGAEGPLFPLPAGDARIAVGVGYRRNEFRYINLITGADTIRGGDSSRSIYAEVDLPLLTPDTQGEGTRRLSLTAAMRGEDYSSFGGVTTPKLGMIFGPGPDFTVKASWGKSFKAPTLLERHYPAAAWLMRPGTFGGTGYAPEATVLVMNGGDPNLEPERADTRSVSLAYHPERLRGVEAELSWFQVDYRNRVIQPIANTSQALSNAIYAPFVDFLPSAQQQADLIATAGAFNNSVGAPYDPDSVVAIIHTQYANAARQDIQGFDLTGSYRLDLPRGTLTMRSSASWLDSAQQTLPTQAPHALAGTLFNPPRMSGRFGGVWKQGGLTTSLFANYRDGVTNRLDGVESSSFTTLDAALRYEMGAQHGIWSGLAFALSVDNVLDRDPPLYQVTSPLYAAPYDSTNYSPIGRFVSLAVSRQW